MAEETTAPITNTESVPQAEAPKESPRLQERVTELSSKVELTAKERDELKVLQDQTARDRDFYKGYADIVATHPEAKNHQEEIREKVLKGYSVEDASFAVLGKAGKLGVSQQPTTPQVAGGSAATAMSGAVTKEIKDMSLAEKREQLAKDLAWS